MISLKKSFEYENYLKKLTSRATSLLQGTYVTPVNIEQNHYKSRAYSEAEDEVVKDPTFADHYGFTPDELIKTLEFLLSEQEALIKAKNEAKKNFNNDYDRLIQVNEKRRAIMPAYEHLLGLKFGTYRKTATGYRFNEEGNETSYTYPVEQITSPDYDMDQVKKIYTRLLEEAEETSSKLEEMASAPVVDYTPKFVRNTKLEDVVAWVKANA